MPTSLWTTSDNLLLFGHYLDMHATINVEDMDEITWNLTENEQVHSKIRLQGMTKCKDMASITLLASWEIWNKRNASVPQ
jgi:hypothetical protein